MILGIMYNEKMHQAIGQAVDKVKATMIVHISFNFQLFQLDKIQFNFVVLFERWVR